MDLKVVKGDKPDFDGIPDFLNKAITDAIAKFEKYKMDVIFESLQRHFNINPAAGGLKRVTLIRDENNPFRESYYVDLKVDESKPVDLTKHADKLVARFIYEWGSLTDPMPKLIGWSPVKDSKFMATESEASRGEPGKTPDPK